MRSEFEESLSIFPFVPYAISLCLRVSYRELRLSKTTVHQSRAKLQLQTACRLLLKYRETFAFAERMVNLAGQTIQEMDKAATSISQARNRNREGIYQTQNPRNTLTDGGHRISDAALLPEHESGASSERDSGLEKASKPFIQQDWPLSDLDFTLDESTNLDIFDYFDPDFNLDAIDAALAQNISADALPDSDFGSDIGFTPVTTHPERPTGNFTSMSMS